MCEWIVHFSILMTWLNQMTKKKNTHGGDGTKISWNSEICISISFWKLNFCAWWKLVLFCSESNKNSIVHDFHRLRHFLNSSELTKRFDSTDLRTHLPTTCTRMLWKTKTFRQTIMTFDENEIFLSEITYRMQCGSLKKSNCEPT